ncbi:MAG: hypothetical protein V4548_06860 [Bacteroidota bacterium]
MKKLILILFFLVFYNSFSQTDKLSKEVIKDIIEHRPFRKGEIKIASTITCTHLNNFIYKLGESKGIVLDEKAKFNKDSIHLRLKEREYLATALREQADTLIWKEKDMMSYGIISDPKEILPFLRQNSVIEISNPLFIRNNELALVFLDIVVIMKKIPAIVMFVI